MVIINFLFDQYVRTLLTKAELQVCGFRYFNIYGLHDRYKGDMASLVLHSNNQINTGENSQLFSGSKDFNRDFIYVDYIATVNP